LGKWNSLPSKESLCILTDTQYYNIAIIRLQYMPYRCPINGLRRYKATKNYVLTEKRYWFQSRYYIVIILLGGVKLFVVLLTYVACSSELLWELIIRRKNHFDYIHGNIASIYCLCMKYQQVYQLYRYQYRWRLHCNHQHHILFKWEQITRTT